MTVADGSRKLKIGLLLPQAEGMRGPGDPAAASHRR